MERSVSTKNVIDAKSSTSVTYDHDDDDHGMKEDEEEDTGVQIRVSFHLAREYHTVVPSLHVPNDTIAVPADIHRKGLSTIINHLLDRHDIVEEDDGNDDDDINTKQLPTIPFEFMIGSNDKTSSNKSDSNNNDNNDNSGRHRLFRSILGIEREVRKLGLSLEEVIVVTYFPAQLPPEPCWNTDPEDPPPVLPDWISTMQCCLRPTVTTTATATNDGRHASSLSSSLLCTGCYDGSIVILETSTATTTTSGNQSSLQHQQSKSTTVDSPSISLTMVATKAGAHNGPIHCLSTAQRNHSNSNNNNKNDLFIVTGSMDHTLRIHTLSIVEHHDRPSKYQFDDDTNCVDCCGDNGHIAAISSVDTMTANATNAPSSLLYMASGDCDGTVCIWKYNTNNDFGVNDIPDDADAVVAGKEQQPRSSKKTKTATGDVADGTATVTKVMTTKEISPISTFRAHASRVSGVAFGNYEKLQSTSSSSPKQLITGSWDHSIKVWDIERQDNISTMNGQRVVTCFDTSYHTSGIVVTGHPDCTVRLWDTRTTTTSTSSPAVSDTTFKPSHKEWVSCVQWSPTNPYHIVSTSYDGTMKLWDIRTSLPLYTVRTFPSKQKGLSVCYSTDGQHVFAGGTDGVVKKYQLQ